MALRVLLNYARAGGRYLFLTRIYDVTSRDRYDRYDEVYCSQIDIICKKVRREKEEERKE